MQTFMVLNFENIPEQILHKFRGGEKDTAARMHTDEYNKIMRGHLEPGASIGLHTHDTSSEIIYILKGRGMVLYDGCEEAVEAGICHYCPKGHSHSLINNSTEELIFFAVVPEQ